MSAVGGNIIGYRLGICFTDEDIDKGAAVYYYGTLKFTLFVRRGWCERGFERFHSSGFGGRPTIQPTTAADMKATLPSFFYFLANYLDGQLKMFLEGYTVMLPINLLVNYSASQPTMCLTNLQDGPLRILTANDPSIRLVE